MLQHVQYRHGLETNRLSVTPLRGEPLWAYDEKRLYVGDGITPGGIWIAGPAIAELLYGEVICTPPIDDNDILIYDASESHWENRKLTLGNIFDVNLGSALNDQMLKYDETIAEWINFTPNFDSSMLADFDLTGVSNGDMLSYDATDSRYEVTSKINIQDDINYNVDTGYKHIFKINNIEVASVDQYGLAGAHYNSDFAETFLTNLTKLPLEGTPVGLDHNGKVITLENEEIGTANFIGLVSYHPGHLLGHREPSGWKDTLINLR